MSMDDQLTAGFDAGPTPAAVFRKSQWCWYWLIFGVAAGAAGSLAEGKSDGLAASVIVVYALQGLIAEGLGVRVSANRISVPRRLNPLLPQLLLWRASGSLEELEFVSSLSKLDKGCAAILRWTDASEIPVVFSSRQSKLSFFRTLRQFRPQIGFYRRQG